MSKNIPVVEVSNDTFGDLYSITSELANAFMTTVTVSSNSTGETTTGNGYVVGILGANTVVATSIRGGTIGNSDLLTVTSNLNVSGTQTNVVSNTRVQGANVVIAANSTIDVISVTGNSSATMLALGGTSANVTANVEIRGTKFRIPVGNSSNRPGGPTGGLLRYNEETNLLEIYSGGSWQSFVSYSNTFTATAVSFSNTADITSNNVQTAIEEVWNEKVSRVGDTITGDVVINKNGLALPTPANGSALQVGQPDSTSSLVELVTFAAVAGLIGKRSDGTNASKSAVGNNATLAKIAGYAYDGSSYGTEQVGVDLRTAQAQNSTSKGTKVVLRITPVDGTAVQETVTVTSNSLVANVSISANSLSVTGNVSAVGFSATTATLTGNLNANGALLTTINASSLATGTVPVARLPAANTTSNGAIAIANTSEFRANSTNTKALSPGYVWESAQEVTLGYSTTTVVTSGDAGLDFSKMINAVITLTQNSTLGQPLNVKVGQTGCIRIVQDGTGNRTLSFHADWEFSGGTAPSVSTAASTNDLLFYHVLASGRIFASIVTAVV